MNEAEALRLRLNGVPVSRIAERLEVSETSVRNYVQRELDRQVDPENLRQMLALHTARYTDLINEHYQKAKTDPDAAYLVLKIMAQQERLHGIAKGKQLNIDLNVSQGKSAEEIRQELTERAKERMMQDAIEAEVVDDD